MWRVAMGLPLRTCALRLGKTARGAITLGRVPSPTSSALAADLCAMRSHLGDHALRRGLARGLASRGRASSPRGAVSAAAAGGSAGGAAGGGEGQPKSTRKKRRLDEVCLEQYPEHSRNVIQSWITQGKVVVNGRVVFKAGTQVAGGADIVINAAVPKFVCRAGLKMEAALDAFDIDPTGLTCLDSGLSTGGFTDCLLQRGAEKVYGVDVGYGQVAEKIRVHPQVVVMERTNLRHVGELPGGVLCQLATLDLSFISVLKVLPAVCRMLEPRGEMIILIKPQFEAEKGQVASGGVVRDDDIREKILTRVIEGVEEGFGFECRGHIVSPIKGATSGNTEFLAHFVRVRDVELPPLKGAVGGGGEDAEEGQSP